MEVGAEFVSACDHMCVYICVYRNTHTYTSAHKKIYMAFKFCPEALMKSLFTNEIAATVNQGRVTHNIFLNNWYASEARSTGI